jgi:hypothetical protein
LSSEAALRTGVASLALVLFLGLGSVADGAVAPISRSDENLRLLKARGQEQWCAQRWNQMRMNWSPTIAHVSGKSGCSIVLAYSLRLDQAACGSKSTLAGAPGWCVDRRSGFICRIDKFGAYGCATHASPIKVRRWNAAVTARRLTLNHPPLSPVTTPRPRWTVSYPYRDGFIHPWSTTGRLRKGLTLKGAQHADCSSSSEKTSAGGALRCLVSASDRLYDPCFPAIRTRPIVACSEAPGSKHFIRVLMT